MAKRIQILQVPGVNDEAWRQAIADRCYAAGWRYYEHWGSGVLEVDPDVDCVAVVWSRPAEPVSGVTWLVQTCTPEHALEALVERFGATAENAPIHVSNRYLFATDLALAGAPVGTLYDAEFEIPGLGAVTNPAVSVTPSPDAGGPLSLYRNIPPHHRSMVWSADVLDFSESVELGRSRDGVTVDLTGRRRILTQGPHISLPRGLWRVEFRIVLDAPGPTVLRFAWGDAAMEATLDRPGTYELTLTG